MPIIEIRTNDGVTFHVDEDVGKCSLVIAAMEGGVNGKVVHLPGVSAVIFKKIIEWATFHKNDPEPVDNDDDTIGLQDTNEFSDDEEYYSEVHGSQRGFQSAMSAWDAEFFKMDPGTLSELIAAADYLQIKGLFQMSCKAFANILKGKSVVEVMKKDEANA